MERVELVSTTLRRAAGLVLYPCTLCPSPAKKFWQRVGASNTVPYIGGTGGTKGTKQQRRGFWRTPPTLRGVRQRVQIKGKVMIDNKFAFYEGEYDNPPTPEDENPLAGIDLAFMEDPTLSHRQITALLHKILVAHSRRAVVGDDRAARTVVALTERIAKLRGFDAPKEVAMEVRRVDLSDYAKLPTAELERLLAEMTAIPSTSERIDD